GTSWQQLGHDRVAGMLTAVIPGRAQRESGIHTPDGGYGFRACAKCGASRNDKGEACAKRRIPE
ncbi:MAG: hypothetical protein WA303_22040, partial [Bradyrhizobium sp.]